tara:strand:- start:149 stop:253 length:105 start_codon:yes stop_codon:yes gene_type:complete
MKMEADWGKAGGVKSKLDAKEEKERNKSGACSIF